eukprot:GGOE01002310.1.p1 GENE.GGOE01002310.1~~GGOE01002310.1.p1  ORF type:complete len:171 (-),score=69.54 GGOE01002310.1:518-1030(-)
MYETGRVPSRKDEADEVERLQRENGELNRRLRESAVREEQLIAELTNLDAELAEAQQSPSAAQRSDAAVDGCAECSHLEAELEAIKAEAAQQAAAQQQEIDRLRTIVDLATRDTVKGAAHEVELEDALATAQKELGVLQAEQDALVEEVATLRLANQQLTEQLASWTQVV